MTEYGRAWSLGIDLGGSKILAQVFDADFNVLGKAKQPTKADKGYEAVVERIAEVAREALAEAGCSAPEMRLVGIGAPGPVDPANGVVITAVNLGWQQRPLAADLQAALGCGPVVLGNDVNFGALGEATRGCAAGAASAFAAFMGTGLGGALVIDGQVINGRHGFAGEFGHIALPKKGGQYGSDDQDTVTLERRASKVGIREMLQLAVADGAPCAIKFEKGLKSKQLRRAWKEACPTVTWALQLAAQHLGWGLGLVMAVADPEVFILGGGVLEDLGPELEPHIRQGMSSFTFFKDHCQPELRFASLGGGAVAVGAAVAAIQEQSAVGQPALGAP